MFGMTERHVVRRRLEGFAFAAGGAVFLGCQSVDLILPNLLACTPLLDSSRESREESSEFVYLFVCEGMCGAHEQDGRLRLGRLKK
jgi:hypothetical protein